MTESHNELKEFINDKFNAHEDLEALRFKRIDELLSQFSKEVDSNEATIKRVHTRVERKQCDEEQDGVCQIMMQCVHFLCFGFVTGERFYLAG